MGKRLAIIVAVEHYSDTRIKSVKWAENDANGFATALEQGGSLDKHFLLSGKATKTTITSQVRQQVKALMADDELYVFYAGHGFSKNGRNFITCHDTDLDDLEETSIDLKQLLDMCGQSACKRIAVFLDSCESGITDLPDIRGIYTTLSEKELSSFFETAKYMTCFASCKTSESSYSSDTLKHGVWTFLVIQALEGADRRALESGRYVTAISLQNYLTKEIPRTLRKIFTKPVSQTPWLYGSQSGDFMISDLDKVLKQKTKAKTGYDQVKNVFLRLEEAVKVASLSGFIKGSHRAPSNNSTSTERFVKMISKKEVEEEVGDIFERIRLNMNYKRRDLVTDDGHISTPDFEFWVECTQDPDEPAMANIEKRLTNISPGIVDDDGFNAVFDNSFDNLTYEFMARIDVEDLIDQFEELEMDTIEIEYPSDFSHCEITIDESDVGIRITAHELTVHSPDPTSPKLLVQSFFEVQKKLAGSPVLRYIEKSSTK